MKIKKFDELNESIGRSVRKYTDDEMDDIDFTKSEKDDYIDNDDSKKYNLKDIIYAFEYGLKIENECDGIPYNSKDYKEKVKKGIKDLIKKLSHK